MYLEIFEHRIGTVVICASVWHNSFSKVCLALVKYNILMTKLQSSFSTNFLTSLVYFPGYNRNFVMLGMELSKGIKRLMVVGEVRIMNILT